MAIDFNHTIVAARDSKASAEFLAEMLGLPDVRAWGPFQMVTTENGANLDFMDTQGEIAPSTTPSSSANRNSMKSSVGFAHAHFPTGQTPRGGNLVRSITTTEDAASTLKIRTVICWRLSQSRTAVVAGIRKGLAA
jgi:hypothetical protein